jgi:hypothetical protein
VPDFGPALGAPQPPTLWDRLQGLGSQIGQWYNAQPSWLDQAQAAKQSGDWRTLQPTDQQINFGMNMVGPTALGIRAYHGSPHDFDKFDLSKIGSGEGSQKYSWGLYSAENPQVAEHYQDLSYLHPGQKTPGRMYELDINADPAHFLDWDRPLSEQPEIASKIKPLMRSYDENMTGGVAYNEIMAQQGIDRRQAGEAFITPRPQEASEALRDAGVPGTKFFDQRSRGQKEGTRNYVVYDDKLIDILKKYGLATLGLGGAASMAKPTLGLNQ